MADDVHLSEILNIFHISREVAILKAFAKANRIFIAPKSQTKHHKPK